jgi:phosphate transport system substrate-binding protein
MKLFTVLTAFFLALPASAATQVHGAGSSFIAPLFTKWISEFSKANPDMQINYQSVGSGAGIRQFSQKTVDFGATDAFMTDDQLKASAKVLHVPVAMGAVVVTYNLPGLPKAIQIDGPTLADIFLGNIKVWNDPRIVKLNPGLALPSQPILVVHRSDGSGTTAIFTEYLSKVSPAWKDKVGSATAVKWPSGLGGKGNEGVAGLVKQTPGSVGYVELIYAKSNSLPFASVKNSTGAVVEPTLESVTAAASGALKSMPEDFRGTITNVQGKAAYPISGLTWVLVWDQPGTEPKASGLNRFLQWALKDGQAFAAQLHYAPLPPSLAKKAIGKLQALEPKKL